MGTGSGPNLKILENFTGWAVARPHFETVPVVSPMATATGPSRGQERPVDAGTTRYGFAHEKENRPERWDEMEVMNPWSGQFLLDA
jgi:hypothetical protein